jgi:hypothetical protein
MCSVDLSTAPFVTHIEMIFRFCPCTVQHFTGSAVCSSDDSITQLIHILCYFTMNRLTNPQKKNPESNLENEGAWEWVLSNDQGIPCPERHEHDGGSGVVLPQGHDAKQRSHLVSFPTQRVSLNRCCLVRVHMIKLASNTGEAFQVCQPERAVHFLPHWTHLCELKRNGKEIGCLTPRACAQKMTKRKELVDLPH